MKNHFMIQFCALVVSAFIMFSGCAPTRKVPMIDPVQCEAIGSAGTAFIPTILPLLNDYLAGEEFEVTDRKTVKFLGVSQLSFENCTAIVRLEIVLKRQLRRDAKGYAIFKADVKELTAQRICIQNMRITKLSLSHLTRVGERIIEAVAKRNLPDGKCIEYGV